MFKTCSELPRTSNIYKFYSNNTYRLRVFENRVLRRILKPKTAKVMGGLTKLHYEKICNLCSSPSQLEQSSQGGWMGRAGSMKWNTYMIMVGKLEGKRPLGKQTRRKLDNIKMDLR
jgi:hypothetical protein